MSERLLMDTARRLTERDRFLLTLLWEHRVLTTEQMTALAFRSPTTARHRLTALHGMRLVDRFQPRLTDTRLADYHYVLDHLGSYVVVADRGGDPDALGWRKENALAITHSQRLAHTVGTNGLFVALAAHARRHPDACLHLWWSEARFARWCAEQTALWPEVEMSAGTLATWERIPRARPDAYGVWRERHAALGFACEYDRGTEPLARLIGKIGGYVELAWLLGAPPWLLFAFPSARREANARRALTGSAVPIATAYAVTDPAGAVWLPLDVAGVGRVRLAALALLRPPVPVRPLLGALAVPGSRAARRRTSFAEGDGGPVPTPLDPDGRGERRYAYA